MLIRLGHSPDPDDAFMFWALASGEIDTRDFEFEHVLKDIQTLNLWALDGRLEVTALSLHAYPFVRLHSPSAYYGVHSLPLGEDRVDAVGENSGFYERATGTQVQDYFAEAALMDLDNLEHNTRDGLHIASLAGTWIVAVAGFGGMRDHGGALSFAPRLPQRLTRLAFSRARPSASGGGGVSRACSTAGPSRSPSSSQGSRSSGLCDFGAIIAFFLGGVQQ